MRIVNPHGWNTTTLFINGKRFDGVEGSEPFYLDLSNRNAIVFATRQPSTPTVVHLYDFDMNEVTSVNAGEASFGTGIGLNRPEERDLVEACTSNELAVASIFLGRKTIWHIDLRRKKVVDKEIFDYDQDNRITNHAIIRLTEP